MALLDGREEGVLATLGHQMGYFLFLRFRQIMIMLPLLPPFMQKVHFYYIFTDDNELRNQLVFCLHLYCFKSKKGKNYPPLKDVRRK